MLCDQLLLRRHIPSYHIKCKNVIVNEGSSANTKLKDNDLKREKLICSLFKRPESFKKSQIEF